MSKLLTLTLEVFVLVVCFLLSAAVVSFACSVTNRTIIESHLDDCSPNGSSQIYKTETNQITFSDGDFDNVQTYGLGHCGSPSVSGSFTNVTQHSILRPRVLVRRVNVIACAGVNLFKGRWTLAVCFPAVV